MGLALKIVAQLVQRVETNGFWIAINKAFGSRTFKLSNMGPTDLILCLSTTPDSIQGTYETIAPDGVITRTTSNLNPDINATHLLMQNTEPEMGSYKIWVKE